MNYEEKKARVSENNAALLLVGGEGLASTIPDAVTAGKLLGKIREIKPTPIKAFLAIPKDAIAEAGLKTENWQKAEAIGMVSSRVIDGKDSYLMPKVIYDDDKIIPNTLVTHLESISGITHENAIANAAKYSASQAGAKDGKGR